LRRLSRAILGNRAIKQIVRYLNNTQTQDLVMKPTGELTVDCYVDGLLRPLRSEDDQDTTLRYLADCQCDYYQKLPLDVEFQTTGQVALSAMEAEYRLSAARGTIFFP
jgi:hypothetical protein